MAPMQNPLKLKSERKLSSVKPGSNGSTMPKPTKSIKTDKKITRMDGLRFIVATGAKV